MPVLFIVDTVKQVISSVYFPILLVAEGRACFVSFTNVHCCLHGWLLSVQWNLLIVFLCCDRWN